MTVQKSKTPTTVAAVEGAKSNESKTILQHARHVVCAVFLSPVYQTAIAVVTTVGIILMGGRA